MSVGGKIFDKRLSIAVGYGRVREYCVIDRNGDETAVRALIAHEEPEIGDQIWWQSGVIFFDNDGKKLKKIGNSYTPLSPRQRLENLADALVEDIMTMPSDELRREFEQEGISVEEITRVMNDAVKRAHQRK